MRSSPGEVSAAKWRWAPFLILAAAFCLFAWRSWRTWPDVLVDFGHELYIPWRLTEGDRLYETIAFTMGPLSQSFNALLFRLFGVSLSTLIWANLVILAGITGLLFEIFRLCGTRATATAATLFFLAVFAFSQYTIIGNYNYVCPYRHEMTHGLALGLAELYCLIRSGERHDRRWLIAAGFFLGLVGLTKAEPLLPAVACAAVAVGFGRISRSETAADPSSPQREYSSGKALLDGGALLGAAIVAPLASLLLFAATRGWSGAWSATFGWLGYVLDSRLTQSAFYQSLAGWDVPAARAASILLTVAGYLGGLVVAYLAESILGRVARKRYVAGGLGVLTAISAPYLIGFGSDLLGFHVTPGQWSQLGGVLPVLVPLVVIVTGRRVIRASRPVQANAPAMAKDRTAPSRPAWPLFLVSVFALGLLPKIFLNPQWGHYGFVLAMPGTLVLIHVTIVSVPAWLRRKHMSARAFTAVAGGLLASCALIQCLLWDRACQAKTVPLGAGGDQFYVLPDLDERALPTVKTLEFLRRTVRDGETLVVIPEGTTLNYLLRARNPTPYLMFSPWEFAALGGEAVVEQSVVESRPDYFVIVSMDMTIHGRGNFGDPGFGEGILKFIQDEYQLIDAHVSPDESFQAAVFQRKPEGRVEEGARHSKE